jgi:myo-inositol-1(or 4)-monophosphatase
LITTPPWLAELPEHLRDAGIGPFLGQLCSLSAELLDRQAAVVADPDTLSGLEWDLEQRMISLIRECVGPVPILAEEYFARHGRRLDGTGRWRCVLDPLDGSASYARGSRRFATSLAVTDGETSVLALVYEPVTGLLYSALAGHGCFVGDEPIVRSRPARRTAVIKEQWVKRMPALSERVDRLTARGYGLERMEATSLKLCWVAQGRRAGLLKWLSQVDGVVLEWGTTAGLLICREAGMVARRLDGTPWSGDGGGLVVGDDTYLGDLGFGDRGPTTPTNRPAA